jgi:hypothetical protein
MATKQKVQTLAKKLNCELDIEARYIEVAAPKGKVMGDDYLHYSGYEVGLYLKSEIWSRLAEEMSDLKDCAGTDFCDCVEK